MYQAKSWNFLYLLLTKAYTPHSGILLSPITRAFYITEKSSMLPLKEKVIKSPIQ